MKHERKSNDGFFPVFLKRGWKAQATSAIFETPIREKFHERIGALEPRVVIWRAPCPWRVSMIAGNFAKISSRSWRSRAGWRGCASTVKVESIGLWQKAATGSNMCFEGPLDDIKIKPEMGSAAILRNIAVTVELRNEYIVPINFSSDSIIATKKQSDMAGQENRNLRESVREALLAQHQLEIFLLALPCPTFLQ